MKLKLLGLLLTVTTMPNVFADAECGGKKLNKQFKDGQFYTISNNWGHCDAFVHRNPDGTDSTEPSYYYGYCVMKKPLEIADQLRKGWRDGPVAEKIGDEDVGRSDAKSAARRMYLAGLVKASRDCGPTGSNCGIKEGSKFCPRQNELTLKNPYND